jgi:hypothetical protein
MAMAMAMASGCHLACGAAGPDDEDEDGAVEMVSGSDLSRGESHVGRQDGEGKQRFASHCDWPIEFAVET